MPDLADPVFSPHGQRRVSIEEGRRLQKLGAEILWRPDGEECAVVLEEPTEGEN